MTCLLLNLYTMILFFLNYRLEGDKEMEIVYQVYISFIDLLQLLRIL